MRSLRSSLIFLLATLFAVATALNFVKQNAKADGAPTTPPANICGNTSLLSGPSTAPNGAVTVAAGDNTSAAAAGDYDSANTTYYFATGTHTIEAQIIPGITRRISVPLEQLSTVAVQKIMSGPSQQPMLRLST